ncbi:MAG TPA: hypothetical protein VLA66_05335, partial [Thermoanaerobaculia bacterium]|nr:hypothetical protein [Thermoanaerobaculia bacterium]
TYDQTPGDHFDQPLIANPRLRDGDLEQPAGLPLGPSNLPDLNLALDFGRSAEVDEVRIVARDPLGNPLTTGGPVVWDVWVSDDGIRWLPALEGATTAFDTARSHWSVRFPLRVARWVQVVSFFVNSVPTELTEVQAYASDAIPGGAPRSEDYLLESGRGNLTVRATDRVTVSWQGLWTRSRSARELRDETEISNSDQLLLLDWSLPADLSLELRGEFRDQERTEGIDRSSRGYQGLTGLLRWQPDPDLDTVLEVTRGRDEIDGVGLDLDRAFLRALLRPWRGLEISLDAGRQVQDFAGGLATIETPSASGYVKAWLAPSLIVTLQASTSRAKVDGELPPELLIDVQTDRWYADVQWVPSGRLNLGARFGRAEGGGTSTPIQAYRLIWSPFAGGAVALVARYDENVDPVRDRRSRRLIVTPTWTINRHLRLSLDFQQSQTSVAGEVDDIRSFSASLGTDF